MYWLAAQVYRFNLDYRVHWRQTGPDWDKFQKERRERAVKDLQDN